MLTTAWAPALVGRERELEILEQELAQASSGPPRCVLVLGDAGVGKTRLAGQFVGRHDGLARLVARAHPLGVTTPFGLWIEALERHLRVRSPEDIRRLCRGVVSDLAALLRSVAAVAGPGAEREPPRARILEAIAVVVAGLAADGPVIVDLDDIHDADTSSIETLAYVLRTVAGDGLLIVLAARPGDLASRAELSDLVSALEQDGMLRRLELAPLDRGELGTLAGSVTHRAVVPESLVSWLQERSEGNPLFALGLLHALVESGGDIEAPALQRVPATLAARVEARVQRLDEPARATLETMAVLGALVDFADLLRIAGRPADRLAPILEELTRHRLVVEEERGSRLVYGIAHPLVREAVYQRMGAARRRAMHRLVARALLAGGRLAEAAPHFARSADPGDEEAVIAIREAIGQAERRELHREALMLLDTLADLIPSGDPRWVEVLDEMQWDAEWVIDHRADSYASIGIRPLEEIRRVLLARGDHARLGTVELRLASFVGWGRRDVATGLAHAQRAVEHFRRAGQPGRARMAAHEVGYQHGLSLDPVRHVEVATAVLEDAESAGDRLMAMEALGSLAVARMNLGELEAAHHLLLRSAAIAEADGKRYRLTWNRCFIAQTLALMGRVSEAREVMAHAVASDPDYRETMIVEVDCQVSWLAGDLPGVVTRALEAATWNSAGLSGRRAWAMAIAAVAEVDRGRALEADRHLGRANAAYGGREFGWLSPHCRWAEGVIALRAGQAEAACAALQRAIDGWGGDATAYPPAALAFADLVEAALACARTGAAEAAAERLRGLEAGVGGDLTGGLRRLGEARLHITAGRDAEAARDATDAVTRFERGGMRLLTAQAHELHGVALARGDREAAVEVLVTAASLYTDCGATARRAVVLQTLGGLGDRGRRSAVVLRGERLSPRELEVARLAAAGLTARQIGERLFIGHRTVETHLAAAYAKLGVGSRVELVRRLGSMDG